MRAYKYKWTRQYAVDAQTAGEIFQSCGDDAAVLELARAQAHPLHSLLEWEQSRAAEAYRLYQVRQMRCSLVCEVVTKDHEVENVRAFVRTVDRCGYVPTLEANPQTLSAAEKTCWLQMKNFRARWRGLQFARVVVEAIEIKEQNLRRTKKTRQKKGAA